MKTKPQCVVSPFAVVIDTREQRPFAFDSLRTDKAAGSVPLDVQTVRGTLPSGDYSILGLEHLVRIERKSAADLYSTIGQGRARFERELERLNELPHAFVVVEDDWRGLKEYPPPYSELSYKTVFRSVTAWEVRYSRVHWCFCPGRAFAEVKTYRLLERVWKAQQNSAQ